MKQHRFWAWAAVFCFLMVFYTGYRAKECVMKTAVTIQENAEDIYAEAQQINEERAAQEAANVEENVEENAGAKDFDEVEKE